jgi:BON domain-containing protein
MMRPPAGRIIRQLLKRRVHMSEPFFGSVPGTPMWPSIPAQGFASFQSPIGLGNRPLGIGSEPFGQPYAPGGGMSAFNQLFPSQATFAGSPSTYGYTPQTYALGGAAGAPGSSGLGQGNPVAQSAQNVPGHVVGGSGAFTGFGGYEVPAGITAPALLTVVAMRRGQPLGPANDQELEEFLYEVLDLLPGTNDVEIRCEGGRVTLTGTVGHKRLKRDVGEIAWTMNGVNDVVNNVNIASRRRARGREPEPSQPAVRKQA